MTSRIRTKHGSGWSIRLDGWSDIFRVPVLVNDPAHKLCDRHAEAMGLLCQKSVLRRGEYD